MTSHERCLAIARRGLFSISVLIILCLASNPAIGSPPVKKPLHPISGPTDVRTGTPYEFAVTPAGAATWSMPLWTPPGRNGIQPNLVINYSSKAGNGWMGLGFSLSGFSSISRCWKTPAQDGRYSEGPIPDEYCLDGQRLIQSHTGTLVFTPEFDPGKRVEITGGSRTEPQAFTVRTKEGTILRYGSRDPLAQSRLEAEPILIASYPRDTDTTTETRGNAPRAIAWYLDRIEDTWGNHVDFNYVRPTDANGVEVLPAEILWTGNGNTIPPSRKMIFEFGEDRVDPRTGFQAGIPIRAAKRLTKITILGEDRLTSDTGGHLPLKALREYRFSYLSPGTRLIDRLQSIEECVTETPTTPSAQTSWTCLDPVRFEWMGIGNDRSPKFRKYPVPNSDFWYHYSDADVAAELADLAVGDFNGDGRDDIVFRVPAHHMGRSLLVVRRKTPTGTDIAEGQWKLSLGSWTGLGTAQASGLPNSLGGSPANSPRAFDFDNDGTSEIVMNTETPWGMLDGPVAQQYEFFSFQGGQFAPIAGLGEHYSIPWISGYPEKSFAFQAGDFDGDGATDIIRDNVPAGAASNPVYLSQVFFRKGVRGSQFQQTIVLDQRDNDGQRPVGVGVGAQEKHVLDIDGNGRVEFLTRAKGGGIFASQALDGLPWTMAAVSLGSNSSANSTVRQTGLHAASIEESDVLARLVGETCSGVGSEHYFSRWFVDLNGDGLKDSLAVSPLDFDVCAHNRDVGLLLSSLNIGTDFKPAVSQRLEKAYSVNPSVLLNRAGVPQYVDQGVRIVDIDRDGREDLLLVNSYRGRLADADGDTFPNRTAFLGLRSSGRSFEPMAVNIPISDEGFQQDYDDSGIYGPGPRMTRVGDFDGDGLFDIVTTELIESPSPFVMSRRLVVWFQDHTRVEPDVIRKFSGGPLKPAVRVTYDYAGPNNPSLYVPGTSCRFPQRCAKSLGWVVREYKVEAVGFADIFNNDVLSNSYVYEYADARHDLMGRGFVGVGRVTRRDWTSPDVIESVMEFDLTSKVTAAGTTGTERYAYSKAQTPTHVTTKVPLTGPSPHDHIVSQTRDRSLAEAGGVYRLTSEVGITTERDGGAVVRSSRTTRSFDTFENTTQVTTEVWDEDFMANPNPSGSATIYRTDWRVVGVNQPDTQAWLLSRYPRYQITSVEPGNPGMTTTRKTDLVYEIGHPEVRHLIIEPNAPGEYPDTSGLRREFRFARDPYGNVLSRQEIGSGQTRTDSWTYDALDHLYPITQTDPLSFADTHYFHAGFGLLVARDDASGMRTEMEYDALMRPKVLHSGIRVSDLAVGGPKKTWTYYVDDFPFPRPGRSNRIMSVTETLDTGKRISTSLDPYGKTLEISWTGGWEGLGGSKKFVYDRFGRVIRERLPVGPWNREGLYVEYSYDLLGRLISVSRPGETSRAPRYTSSIKYCDRSVTHISERGISSTSRYDAKGRLIEHFVIDPTSWRRVSTRYEYAPFDLLRRVSYPTLNVPMTPGPAIPEMTRTYDVLGRPETLNEANGGRSETRYNAFGEVKRVVDATGSVTTRSYDPLGRVLSVVTPATTDYASPRNNGFAQHTIYTWDTGGVPPRSLSVVTSNDGITTAFTYDGFARPETVTWQTPNERYAFGYTYDRFSRVSTLEYPQSSSGQPFRIRYDYDNWGELQNIFDASNLNAQRLLWRQIERNAAGQSIEEQFGSTVRSRRTYDASFQLRFVESSIIQTNSAFQRLSYRWGADGLMVSKTDQVLGLIEHTEHDFLGRLHAWRVWQNCQEARCRYDYDDWGNLRSRTIEAGPGQTVVNDYTLEIDNTKPQAVKRTTEGTASELFTYNAVGSMQTGRGITFDWTPFGLPWRIRNSAYDATLRYDGFGDRIVKSVASGPGNPVETIATVGGLYEHQAKAAEITDLYNVVSPNGMVAQVQRARNVETGASSENVYFIHADILGSPDAVTDALGNLVDRVKYEPFGEKRFAWAVAHPVPAPSGSGVDMGFTGHDPADAFGLTNMKGRLYDAKLGRFISADPIFGLNSQGLNRYSYVLNSPVMFRDPSGYQSQESDWWPYPYFSDTDPETGKGIIGLDLRAPTSVSTSDPSSSEYMNFGEPHAIPDPSIKPGAQEPQIQYPTLSQGDPYTRGCGDLIECTVAGTLFPIIEWGAEAFGEPRDPKLTIALAISKDPEDRVKTDQIDALAKILELSLPFAPKILRGLAGIGVAAETSSVAETVVQGSRSAPRVAPSQSTVPLPNPGENSMAYGSRGHQEFPRIIGETNPGAGGQFNVAPGLTGPDLANPTRMNAAFAEMKSLWGRQAPMLRQARKWGYDAQAGRYFFYDRNTGRVFEGVIQTEKFPSGAFRP